LNRTFLGKSRYRKGIRLIFLNEDVDTEW